MNKKILSAIFAFAVCMSSCNYLDYNESSGFDKEDMFTYFERAKGMLTTVYSYLPASSVAAARVAPSKLPKSAGRYEYTVVSIPFALSK